MGGAQGGGGEVLVCPRSIRSCCLFAACGCRRDRPYIAPEQGARWGQYNHKADMWSLGVILFEMLSPR